jgi:hypothetical protein
MIPLPDVATDVKASEKAIDQLKACAKAMMIGVSGQDLEVLRAGLVCLPIAFRDTHHSHFAIVLPSCHRERPPDCSTDTGRETWWH